MNQLPTIADIQTTELLYYDEAHSQECYRFCKDRDIDCLPNVYNPGKYYQRNSGDAGFSEMDIAEEHRLDAATYIFQPELVARFGKRAVQFVFTNGIFTGVVHFSDYNREPVFTYIYSELARYERDLRDLLVLFQLKNEDMRACFQDIVDRNKDKEKKEKTVEIYSTKINDYENNREKLAKFPQFQWFDLEDLRILAKKRGVIELSDIKGLRNMVMHARDSVEQFDARMPDFIYKYESFITFFDLVQRLLTDRRRVRTRLLLKGRSTTDSAFP